MLGGVQVNVGGVQNMLGGARMKLGGCAPPRKSASERELKAETTWSDRRNARCWSLRTHGWT